MVVLFWRIDNVVVQLVDHPRLRKALELRHFPDVARHVTTLQDHHIGLFALELDNAWGDVVDPPLDPARPFKFGERLDYPVMPHCRGIDRQRQH
ncbi:hypothetical protein D3C76_1478080 [compost metagenome]